MLFNGELKASTKVPAIIWICSGEYYICNVSMCVMYVSYICRIYGCVICVCHWYVCHIYIYATYCHICVSYYLCDYTLHVNVCLCVCTCTCHSVWLEVRGQLERDCCLFPSYYLTSVLRLGRAFFPWSHQPLVCLFFSLSDSMSWTSLYFVILFKIDVCGIWNCHNLNCFILNTKDANALSPGYFFICSPTYVILKEVFLKWTCNTITN